MSGTARGPRAYEAEGAYGGSGPREYGRALADEAPDAGLPAEGVRPERQIALVDLLDRLLTGGVVLTGDVTLSIADVDLVRVSLRALISSVTEQAPAPWIPGLGRGEGGREEAP